MSLKRVFIIKEGSPFDPRNNAGGATPSTPAKQPPVKAKPNNHSFTQQPPTNNDTTHEEREVKNLLKADYPRFVRLLGKHLKDRKFLQAIQSLAKDAPVQSVKMDVPVKSLQPSQNEIDIEKSLEFPLTSAKTAQSYLNGGTVAPGKTGEDMIVTGGGGKFIIDGHHRWSQVFVVNPECQIKALDLSDVKNPMDGLKSTQLGIAANTGDLPVGKANPANNLLKMDSRTVMEYVIKTIQPDVVQLFAKAGKGTTPQAIAKHIAGNVKLMQGKNQPVQGAPSRKIMPQTDNAPDWSTLAPNPEKMGGAAGMTTPARMEAYRRAVGRIIK